MSNVVKTSVFLSCFGGIECDKPYFNNSNSSVENSNDDKFLTTSLLVKCITLLKEDPTKLREGQLQRYLRELKKKQFLDDATYERIYPSGS